MAETCRSVLSALMSIFYHQMNICAFVGVSIEQAITVLTFLYRHAARAPTQRNDVNH